MRRLALLFAGLLLSGMALMPNSLQARNWLEKLHKGTYQVVSVDSKARTITLRDDSGGTNTAPVLGKAVEKLDRFSSGMKVTVTCRDSDDGKHEGVIDIELVQEPADANARSYHEMTCTVVSVDMEGQTITLSDENSDVEFTAPVMGHALDKLADLSFGVRVTITCQDNAKGDHEGIVDIQIAK